MKTYEVAGPLPYLGHPPGEKFEAEIEPAMERRGIARGAIRVVSEETKTKEGES